MQLWTDLLAGGMERRYVASNVWGKAEMAERLGVVIVSTSAVA